MIVVYLSLQNLFVYFSQIDFIDTLTIERSKDIIERFHVYFLVKRHYVCIFVTYCKFHFTDLIILFKLYEGLRFVAFGVFFLNPLLIFPRLFL